MTYQPFLLTEELHITQIITIHYFEYTNTYHFHGESHDFWEFLCVDKGEVTVTAGEKKLTLQQGQIIFHEPNEFHNVQANGKIAPNLVVISFSCDSSCMKQFRNLITTISETEKTFLAQIIREARHCIATPLDNPFTKKMERRTDSPFASEQMIQLYLELLLLSMLRRLNQKEKPGSFRKIHQERKRYHSLSANSAIYEGSSTQPADPGSDLSGESGWKVSVAKTFPERTALRRDPLFFLSENRGSQTDDPPGTGKFYRDLGWFSAILPSIIFPGSLKPLPECLHQNMHFLSKHYRRKTPRTPCTDLWQGYCSLVSLLSTPCSVTTFCFFFSLAFLR